MSGSFYFQLALVYSPNCCGLFSRGPHYRRVDKLDVYSAVALIGHCTLRAVLLTTCMIGFEYVEDIRCRGLDVFQFVSILAGYLFVSRLCHSSALNSAICMGDFTVMSG